MPNRHLKMRAHEVLKPCAYRLRPRSRGKTDGSRAKNTKNTDAMRSVSRPGRFGIQPEAMTPWSARMGTAMTRHAKAKARTRKAVIGWRAIYPSDPFLGAVDEGPESVVLTVDLAACSVADMRVLTEG